MNKYQKAIESVLQKISKGELRVGDKLDSIRKMAPNYNISEPTAVKVVNELKNLGVIDTKDKSGSFVVRTEPLAVKKNKPLNNGTVALFHLKSREDILAIGNYDADILLQAENALKGFGLKLEVAPLLLNEDHFEAVKNYVSTAKKLKGALIFNLDSWENTHNALLHCEANNIKTVCLAEGCRTDVFNIPSVAIDETSAGFLGMEILLEKKIQRPGIILTEYAYQRKRNLSYFMIAKGAELAWLSAGMPPENIIFEYSPKDCMQLSGYKATKKLLEKDSRIDSIIFTHQYLAEGGMEYLSDAGLKAGKDLEIVAIPRWKDSAPWGHPEAHWISYSYADVGRMAGTILGKRVSGQDEVQRVRIQPQIAIKPTIQ